MRSRSAPSPCDFFSWLCTLASPSPTRLCTPLQNHVASVLLSAPCTRWPSDRIVSTMICSPPSGPTTDRRRFQIPPNCTCTLCSCLLLELPCKLLLGEPIENEVTLQRTVIVPLRQCKLYGTPSHVVNVRLLTVAGSRGSADLYPSREKHMYKRAAQVSRSLQR